MFNIHKIKRCLPFGRKDKTNLDSTLKNRDITLLTVCSLSPGKPICMHAFIYINTYMASLVAQTVKRLPTMWKTRVGYLGREKPLEKEMAIHSSTLAWKIPWTEEPGRLQSMGSQRVRHGWENKLSLSYKNISINIYIFRERERGKERKKLHSFVFTHQEPHLYRG